ncbi:MAG: M81 family metallopeptidase [Burkholderiales bacterium]|nr:M81 family metallopeptidase [Burkholderiales bacterium]
MKAAANAVSGPRIGIAGFFLEANRWAPVTTGAMFAQSFDLAGELLLEQLNATPPRTLPDLAGFMAGMSAAGPWQPVPLRAAAAYPGGPAEQAWFDALLQDIEQRLRAALPLDGVFISSHGAALTTGSDDPDGELFEHVRLLVGPDVPVVAVLDLHTNVSARMTDALSAFVAYRTNPHVDLFDRGQEAALLLRAMLSDGPGQVVLEKLPFVPASTDQLIAPGTPYQALVDAGQAQLGGPILNVSLCGGFPLADCGKCGFSVVVTARLGAGAQARDVARTLAAQVWARRQDFVTSLTPLDRAVRLAVEAGEALQRDPLILADVADNPGGGGDGNTTFLLRALIEAGARGVLVAVFTDAALAEEAHRLGCGAVFEAHFNRDMVDDRFALPVQHRARVLALSDGEFVGRKGLLKGSVQRMGPSALLDLGGVQVAVISHRQQLLDPAQLELLGVELGTLRTLVVKSRGHFRAAFDDFAARERIIEVDAPGLSTPNLGTLPLQRIPRPIYPLDPEAVWPA